jgi:hypothetical protein
VKALGSSDHQLVGQCRQRSHSGMGIGSLGHTPTPGFARLTRPTDAKDPRTDACFGRGSGEPSGDPAADDPAQARAHQQTRQRAAALFFGGSGAGHGTKPTTVAQQVLPPRPAGTEDREGAMARSWRCICTGCGGRAGTTTSSKSFVRTRESPEIPMVCSNHRRNLGIPLPRLREFEQVIMIAVSDRRDGWVD